LSDNEDSHLSEEFLALREFSRQEAPALISSLVQTHIPPELRSLQQQAQDFALVVFRRGFETLIEHWSDRTVPQQASSSADSGNVNADRDASSASSPLISRHTQGTSSEDEGELVIPNIAGLGDGLSLGADFVGDFSNDSVVSTLFEEMPDDGGGFDFLYDLEQ
jgi:hypothetical protein